jgi:hypothetical protein
MELGRLLIDGLELRAQRIVTAFGTYATSWIQRLPPVLSANCRNTPIGSSPRQSQYMSHPEELTLLARMLTEEMSGYTSLESDFRNHS